MNELRSLRQSIRESKRYKTPMKEKTKIWFTYPYGEYHGTTEQGCCLIVNIN